MRIGLICIFFGLAGPAFAQTTAVYEAPGVGFRMTIEVAANGDVRGDIAGKPGVYVLTRGGQGYIVIQTADGVVVERVEDEAAALKVVAEKRLGPSFRAMMESIGPDLAREGPLLTKGDDIVVQGRKGTPYYFPGPRRPDMPPVVVMSSDPDLAPLGVAIAGQFDLSGRLQIFSGPNPLSSELDVIMKTGAPIAIAGAELTTVSYEPIPASRFELPAAPSSLEAIIKRIDATATDTSVVAF